MSTSHSDGPLSPAAGTGPDPDHGADAGGPKGSEPVGGPYAGPAPGLTWAGLGVRIVAAIIDQVILGIVWFAALFLFVAVLSAAGRIDPSTFRQADILSGDLTPQEFALAEFGAVIYYLLSGFYHVYAWVRLRATPGQQALRLWVLEARTGHPLGAGRASLRWFVRDLPIVGFVLGILMVLWYAFLAVTIGQDRYRRGLHDRVAGSVVVRRS